MYVDTTIFMYAMGSESRFKEPCARILRAGAADEVALVTSAETLQEVLHRYRSIGRQGDIQPTFEAIAAAVQRVLPVTFEDVDEARRLGARTPAAARASARALVHAAVARRQGLREILTVDAGFVSIPGVVVVDPLEWVAVPPR
ncbi:MAG: type II toxin-antitoxin system VapC family toxin [Thermoleophilia bacterium]|nr:type II toxin-antitoxin system VapC family toxin [Thermoleophilia bacterium]